MKIRGFRIEIGEVENALAAAPEIQKVAVLARNDGPAGLALVAFVQPQGELEPDSLRHFLLDRLPGYMVPSQFVILESLPLNSNGKIDRKSLEGFHLEVQPTDVTPPRTELEEQIAEIWRSVLSLERVGVFDNFFEIGGHSLLATRVVTRMRALHSELSLGFFFKEPTIAGLAGMIESFRKVIEPGEIMAGTEEDREEFEF